jgi:DNA primase
MPQKNIKELVEEAGVVLVPIGENIFRGSCPFHINLNTPSFTVYTATDSWFCFGESIGGDIYSFYSRLKNCSYYASKEALDGDTNLLEEVTMTLDGLSVVDEKDYGQELNFALSKFCRDLMYRKPELVNNVMEFLKKMDKDLTTKKIDAILMAEIIAESRKLEA